jgi:myo-inositol-1(or 4)-monophosphatase
MQRHHLDALIQPAVQLARNYANRRDTLLADEKSPGEFASEADTAIEYVLRRAIAVGFPNAQVIGEECGGSLDETASGWAIDPIDGTTNFLRGLPLWGISVGLLENGESIAGALALPDLDLTMIAIKGQGLTVNGVPFTRTGQAAGGPLIAIGENDYESAEQTDRRASRLRTEGFNVVRYRSAVFSLASAALGRLDGYVEHGCFVWDVAAAAVICREAGMKVETTPLGNSRYAIDARSLN